MTLTDKEKIEEVLKIIRERGWNQAEYSPSLLLDDIKKILES